MSDGSGLQFDQDPIRKAARVEDVGSMKFRRSGALTNIPPWVSRRQAIRTHVRRRGCITVRGLTAAVTSSTNDQLTAFVLVTAFPIGGAGYAYIKEDEYRAVYT